MSDFKKLQSTYLTQKNQAGNSILVGNLRSDLKIDDDFIRRYKDSLKIMQEPDQRDDDYKALHDSLVAYLKTMIPREYQVAYPIVKQNKVEPDCLLEQTQRLIKDWNPDTEYNCPISLYTDLIFSPNCKPNFIIEFRDRQKEQLSASQFRALLDVKQQIGLFRRGLMLASLNNNLFQDGINSAKGDWTQDFLGSDKNKLYKLNKANFGVFQDLQRGVQRQQVEKTEDALKPNHEGVQAFNELNPESTAEMDEVVKDILKFAHEKYPKLEEVFGEDYDAGFIYITHVHGNESSESFNECGQQGDWPILNINLGCSTIMLLGNSIDPLSTTNEDEAPKCLLLDSGSVFFLGKESSTAPRIQLPPQPKSFNMQGKVLQESTRIARIYDTYVTEIDLYYKLSDDDRAIVDIMRNCRMDIQLRKTKFSKEKKKSI